MLLPRASASELCRLIRDSREDLRYNAIASRTMEPERLRRGRAGSFEQHTPQGRAAARQARLDDVRGHPETLCHFGCAETFDLTQDEDLAHAVGQRVDGPFQQIAQLAGEGLPLGVL